MDELKIFLIEDDDDIALLIRKSLERVGHVVTRCRTGADALIVLAQESFDLVLLDQRLQDMTGLEMLHILARDGIAVPVMMVTAWGDEHLATRVLHAGALDYIAKDPRLGFLGELPKRVAEAVRRHRLEERNRLLVSALGSTRDGIMIIDLQGKIIEVNRALEDLTGYSRQEMIGHTPRLFWSGVHHSQEFYARIWQTILSRCSWQGEVTNRRSNGQTQQTSMTIAPIIDDQKRLTHFVGIQRDISEEKRREQKFIQAQKMQSIGTLAGGIAHEFNNLLAGINGYASLALREQGLTPTLQEFMQHVVDLSERAAALTRQLLAFARKPALVRQRTSLPDLLRGTAEMVARTLHVEVSLDLPPSDEPLMVEADANQLQQALVNLALNARDALLTRAARGATNVQRTVTFRLRAVHLDSEQPSSPKPVPPGDYLLIQVQDEGEGMTGEVLRQALDPFFTTKEVGQGTGLGLPMVFGIVQGHQGFLTLDSEPGVGTTVGLYLARLMDAPSTPATGGFMPGSGLFVTDPEVLEPDSSPGKSILVIDDEEAVLDVVRRFLEIERHHVHCVTSGQAAFDAFAAANSFDLVILDLMMPREDAAATMQRIRQLSPDVPVLLCTGLAEAEPAPRLLAMSGTSLIRKPFRMNELWYAVRRAFVAGGGL